ncbi:hypothetical protein K3495_g3550 [Podosphaera aphanis]|nr:hypothetical protein K3495_g3550 [Podosphaera aphanis]
MVSLPLFKLAALLVRHVSKYGANWIKDQAHGHPKFRAYAARYGQSMHQVNMRMAVKVLRDSAAKSRLREKAEAPTAKVEQVSPEEGIPKNNIPGKSSSDPKEIPTSLWKRKFRPLPENKAVDLFADVAGDAFILLVAGSLILFEYLRSAKKPDPHSEKMAELESKIQELDRRENHLEEVENESQLRVTNLEIALADLKKKTSQKEFR